MRKVSFLVLSLFLLVLTGMVSAQQRVSEKLMERVQIEGSIRVIVTLDLPWKANPDANSQEERQQQNEIASAQNRLLAELAGTKHRVVGRLNIVSGMVLEVDGHSLKFLETSPFVKSVEGDAFGSFGLMQSVPLVEADLAWSAKFDGTGKHIAIVDSGVAGNHSFLTGKVVSEACYSALANCPNGQQSQIGTGAGVPCTFNPTVCAHGTRVAAIAAGRSTSFSGVARGAKLIAIQVASNVGGNPQPSITDVILALDRVYALRTTYSIAAVNLSLGWSSYSDQATCDAQNSTVKTSIDNLRAAGIATVVASMNDSLTQAMRAPACISSAIGVGSTTKTDTISPYSNSTNFLSLVAPGGQFSAPDPSGINSSISPVPPGGFGPDSGTSFAAPHVAGAWAILKQKFPTASVGRVLGALQVTALPIYDTRDPSSAHQYVQCRIRIKKALDNFPNPYKTFAGPAGWSLGYNFGINKCQITGAVSRNVFPFETRGFLLSGIGGTFTMFDPPNSTVTQAFGISDTGHITGRADIPIPNYLPVGGFIRFPNGTFEAPISASGSANGGGTMTVGINIRGETAGWWFAPQTQQGNPLHGLFKPLGGAIQTIDKPGATETQYYGINAKPDMIGRWVDAQGFGHSFIGRANGTFEDVNCAGADDTYAFGIDDSGQIVGNYYNATGSFGYIRSTSGTCTVIAVPSSTYTSPTGINNFGMVVGDRGTTTSSRGFVYNSLN